MDYYEPRNSNYCYKDSNVLINKFDIKDSKKLEELETVVISSKLMELREKDIVGNFDINHFIFIHKFLFEDIYSFAGKFRNENIAKGSFQFAEWRFIDSQLDILLTELKEENYLEGLDEEELSSRLAYYMAELNVLHPFREGNGRTIREFIREVAYENGYHLDFDKYDSTELLQAMIESVYDTEHLENIIFNVLEPIRDIEKNDSNFKNLEK